MVTKKKMKKTTKKHATKRPAKSGKKLLASILKKHGIRSAKAAKQPNLFRDPMHQPAGNLTKGLLVRFSPTEYAWIRAAAFDAGRSSAGFIRHATLTAITGLMSKMAPKDRESWTDRALESVVNAPSRASANGAHDE